MAGELLEAAGHWDALAAEQPGDDCGRERAKLYRRTAEALRIQSKTGVAVCACCLKPYGQREGGKH